MSTLYLTEQYHYVKLEGESLRVQASQRGERSAPGAIVRIPLNKIEQVMVLGEITLSTPALHALLERRIPVHYLTAYGRSCGALTADWGKNSGIRLAQYQLFLHDERRFFAARACIQSKLHNMRTLILRYARNRSERSDLEHAATQIRDGLRQLERLEIPAAHQRHERMHGFGPLLGIEGNASAAYYRIFPQLLKSEWNFTGRVRRPPTDPLNALLSFGYVLLTNQIVSLIHAVGLDPGIGVLHQPGFGKPALALDLAESFRAIIVDSVVISLINNGQLTPGDLQENLGAYRLEGSARRTFLERFEARLNEPIQHPIFNERVTYRRCLELQIRLLAKYAQGEIEAYPSFTVR